MLEYDRINVSEEMDVNKTDISEERDICHYWYFLNHGFKYGPYLCNGCHDLIQKTMNYNGVPTASVKGSNYRMHLWCMSKDAAINIMKNSDLHEIGGSL